MKSHTAVKASIEQAEMLPALPEVIYVDMSDIDQDVNYGRRYYSDDYQEQADRAMLKHKADTRLHRAARIKPS